MDEIKVWQWSNLNIKLLLSHQFIKVERMFKGSWHGFLTLAIFYSHLWERLQVSDEMKGLIQFHLLSNHSLSFDRSLVEAIDLTGHSQASFWTKVVSWTRVFDYSFKVLSELCRRMPKNEHVTLCQFGNRINCNWMHNHTVIHPCHCSVIK